ncbi:glucose-6-phosphate isomerase [Acetivibrio sp. MSJd-27]|uniref:glucose-6-phosphate isomerase n=1 Tax=Acetivibrio sp. MSJd-27 TaxID=2841523 RepID=UPI001C0F9941|nr:glucose-6-phosphate isomerase [Acetivibrio sp. MSJd-27]MBU5451485.1 glucose-6-phosphate isomerase [Acetivibrio sp. MSJd-27]
MNTPVFSYKNAESFFDKQELDQMGKKAAKAMEELESGTGRGNDFLGWLHLPENYDRDEFERVKKASEKIRSNSKALIVIGIGGSYLGARAAIEFLNGTLSNAKADGMKVFFAGNSISSSYHYELLEMMKDVDFSVNVISKSGTTTEPAIAFRLFKELLEEKYGREGAKERIYVTTDKQKGALLDLAKEEGYERFTIADDVGGRYSVLTSVGLLPIAAIGADIDQLMEGAKAAHDDLAEKEFEKNPAMVYAALRNLFLEKGKSVEILVNYEPSLQYFSEWYKQLFAESEGKENKGLFPASLNFSSDLHSMGQFVQEGTRIMFETVVSIDSPKYDIQVKEDDKNVDGLNFLAGKTIDFVNKKAYQGTVLAHCDGGVPNLSLHVPQQDAFNLGYLFYFFEKSCAISGYILGINPFDQPGVEAYKKNMFALLGKPGYDDMKAELESRLK